MGISASPFKRENVHTYTVIFFLAVWTIIYSVGDYSYIYDIHWPIALTMVLGSFVAGSTCAGGGAVAFPVMTLLLGFSTIVARDFSAFIQSVGMTSASILIFAHGIKIHKEVAIKATLYGVVAAPLGIMLGGFIGPTYIKVFYLSLGLAFAGVMIYLEFSKRFKKKNDVAKLSKWEGYSLALISIAGGVISGIVGSGIDLLLFSMLVLSLRLDVKVATPTSVVVMAMVSVAISLMRLTVFSKGLEPIVYEMWLSAAPVVLIGAPVGAYFAKIVSAKVLAASIAVALVAQYLLGFLTIEMSLVVVLFSMSILMFSAYAFSKVVKHSNKSNDVEDSIHPVQKSVSDKSLEPANVDYEAPEFIDKDSSLEISKHPKKVS